MKVEITAGALSGALDLAARGHHPVNGKKLHREPDDTIKLLGCPLIVADGARLTVLNHALTHCITAIASATVHEAGSVVAPLKRALLEGFQPDAMVTLDTDGDVLRVICGRSRYRLPTLPVDGYPESFSAGDEAVELDAAAFRGALAQVAFAISEDQTRYYLHGVYLHGRDGFLTAVATDGHRLAKVSTTMSWPNGGIIIPRRAVDQIVRLLQRSGVATVRASSNIVEVATCEFRYCSKLIDGTYPNYARVIPAVGSNKVRVDREELSQAVDRLLAIYDPQRIVAVLGQWGDDGLTMSLPYQADAAIDELAASTTGSGRFAVNLRYLAELLHEFDGEFIEFAVDNVRDPILIFNPSDQGLLGLLMPLRVAAEQLAEAAE